MKAENSQIKLQSNSLSYESQFGFLRGSLPAEPSQAPLDIVYEVTNFICEGSTSSIRTWISIMFQLPEFAVHWQSVLGHFLEDYLQTLTIIFKVITHYYPAFCVWQPGSCLTR